MRRVLSILPARYDEIWTGAKGFYKVEPVVADGGQVVIYSTHLRGAGTYDPVTGERLRVTVTLATGISEAVVRSVNLDYLDPASVDPQAWAADPGTLVIPDAGEHLFRLADS